MRILILNPFSTATREQEHCLSIADPDTEAEFDNIAETYPLPYVQYRYFRLHSAASTIERIVRAEEEGFDAVVIACMYDPGLIEARELVDIPVIGAFESSCHYAAMLGASYGFITVEPNVIPTVYEMARLYGVSEKLVSVKHIGVRASRIFEDVTSAVEIVERTYAAARECIEDGAEVILIGCTLISDMLTEYCENVHADLGVPVIDPLLVAFKTAEMAADLYRRAGLPAVSRAAGYARPPAEDVARIKEIAPRRSALA